MGFITTTQQILQNFLPRWTVGESLRSQQDSLLRLLAVSHAHRVDPKRLIENLAAENPDSYGRKLKSLKRWIAAESSIAVALAHTPDALNEDDTLAIQCAVETETLKETLDFLIEHRQTNQDSSASDSLNSSLAYAFFVFFLVAFLILGFTTFIMPTLVEMFEDFELQLPIAMVALVRFTENYWALTGIALLLLAAFLLAIQSNDVQRVLRRSWLCRYLLGQRTRNTASLLRLLAIPSSAKHPIDATLTGTLTAAAQFHPDRRFRKQLLSVRTHCDSDADVWETLADHRILTPNEGTQLARLGSPSLRGWVLNALADRKHETILGRVEFFTRLGQFLPILLLSIIVAWIVIAVIQTLTSMVLSLT